MNSKGICNSKEVAASYVGTMLRTGHGCGLSTVSEAYYQFLRFHDCFFSLEEFRKEFALFLDALKAASLVRVSAMTTESPMFWLSEETIQEAANRLNVPLFIEEMQNEMD